LCSSMNAMPIIALFMWKQEKRDNCWKWAGGWWHNCSLPCMWMPDSFPTSGLTFFLFENQLFFLAFHLITNQCSLRPKLLFILA
jgi:hypothetical protein